MDIEKEKKPPEETRDTRIPPPRSEPVEPEAATGKEGSDSRELPERGYGWGV